MFITQTSHTYNEYKMSPTSISNVIKLNGN